MYLTRMYSSILSSSHALCFICIHYEWYFGPGSRAKFHLSANSSSVFLYFLFSLSFSCFLARCLHPSSLSSFCSCPFRLFPSPSSSSSCSPFPLLLPLFLQLLGHYRHYLSLPKFRLSINLNYPIFFLPVLLLRSGLDNIYIYFFSFGKFPLSLKSIRLRE